MNDKNSFFKNKLFVSAFLAMLIVSLFSTAVLALKTYNASKSNTAVVEIMRGSGISEKGIERIQDAFDKEIDAYENYREAMANAVVVMKEAGLSDEEIRGALVAINEKGLQKGR